MRRPAILLLFVACGGGSTPPPPDIADPPPPPPPGEVSVRTVDGGVPVAGVRVIFQDHTESTIASELTDSSGFARAEVQFGGTVTAIDPFGKPADGITEIRTWNGVRVGDALSLSRPATPAPISVEFTAPIESSAARYELHTTCGSGTLTNQSGLARGQIDLAGCGATTDVLLLTFDASDLASRSIFRPNLGVSDGATIALPNSYEPVADLALTWSGVEGTAIAATTTLATSRGDLLVQQYDAAINSGVGTHQIPLPNILDGKILTETRLQPREFGFGVQRVFDPQSIDSQQFISVFNEQMPELTSLPELSPPRDVFWGEQTFAAIVLESSIPDANPGDGLNANVVVIELTITRDAKTWRWTLVAPHIGTVARFPALPVELAEFNLAVGDTVVISNFWQARVLGGYETVRARMHDVRRLQDLIEPFGGRIVVQERRD